MTRIAEIKARAEKASTPPWKVATTKEFGYHWPITTGNSSIDGNDYHVCTDHVHASELWGDAKTDAEFIAHARTDIPWLLERNAELLEALKVMTRLMEIAADEISGWSMAGYGGKTVGENIHTAQAAIAEMESQV